MKQFFTERFTTIANYLHTQSVPGWTYWKSLFSWNFWAGIPAVDDKNYTIFYLVINVVFVGALIAWIRNLKTRDRDLPAHQSIVAQLWSLIIFLIVVEIVYVFAVSQSLQYFSNRLIMLAALVICVAWLAALIIYARRVLPASRQRHLEKERFFRYLPKKKERSKK